MERLISDEERIRRAEDILERRRNMDFEYGNSSQEKGQVNNRIRKMLLQVLVCLCIYCGIYYIKNTKNENFNNIITSINNALNYDVDFKQIYNNVWAEIQKINSNKTHTENNEIIDENSNEIQNDDNKTEDESNLQKTEENNSDSVGLNQENESLGIGGGFDDSATAEPLNAELQMQVDAEYIRRKLSMINPLESGIITSGFGSREGSSIVSANHKGIDLGAPTGSIIIAAADGTVIEASTKGDFGTHLKIQCDDVEVIYGHCSELLVNEGDVISKGQEIAKVGATGKATGPHLHFEVRRDLRAVDPQMILDFD